MSEKELKETIKIIKEHRNEVSSSRKKAVESLKKAGICNSKGELNPQYK